MATPTTRPDFGTYGQAIRSAVVEAGCAGGWVAAGELPAGRRRLVRVGVAAAAYTMAPAARPARTGGAAGQGPLPDSGRRAVRGGHGRHDGGTRAAVVAFSAVGVSVALAAGRRQVEKRWLARLIRDGHAHPHRALAVRMTALVFVTVLPARLIEVRLAK